MRGTIRSALGGAAAAAAILSAGPAAQAQDYPNRPITLIVPFAAGGPTDVVARLLGQAMSANLGQPIVVEDIGGAGATVGAARAARAEPDGYTFLINNSSHATASSLYKKIPYDPIGDFEPIGLVVDVPQAIVSKTDLPARTLQELVAYLKANQSRVNLAQAGRGSASHLCALVFMNATGTTLTQVAYKGTGPALTDVMGGQVDMICDQVSTTGGQIKAGTIRGYCVTTTSRVASLPDLAPCAEAGLPGFQVSVWHGLYAPKGTPQPIVARIGEALKVALRDPTVKARLADLGAEPVRDGDVTPAALRTHLKAEVQKWAEIFKAAKLAPE